jgi:hypothetical protein
MITLLIVIITNTTVNMLSLRSHVDYAVRHRTCLELFNSSRGCIRKAASYFTYVSTYMLPQFHVVSYVTNTSCHTIEMHDKQYNNTDVHYVVYLFVQ